MRKRFPVDRGFVVTVTSVLVRDEAGYVPPLRHGERQHAGIGTAEIRAERHKFQRGFAALGDEAEIAPGPGGTVAEHGLKRRNKEVAHGRHGTSAARLKAFDKKAAMEGSAAQLFQRQRQHGAALRVGTDFAEIQRQSRPPIGHGIVEREILITGERQRCGPHRKLTAQAAVHGGQAIQILEGRVRRGEMR